MKKIILLIFFVLILSSFVYAKEGNMKLLAIAETDKGYEGRIADLSLEITKGSGRVFLDTFPLTKLDTQLSTRFAKEISCDYIDVNCNKYDFFYRINADSPIVGGPSAGAAISVLTISLLLDLEINQDMTITGTINSGGIIGPVGGLKEKIDAGKNYNLNTILIPIGESIVKEDNNSLNLIEYADNISIKILEVSTLNDVIFEFTGIKFKEYSDDLLINPDYENTMKDLAILLCNRSTTLRNNIKNIIIPNESSINSSIRTGINLSDKGKIAFDNKEYYSAASYCFGSNVKFSYPIYYFKNYSKKEMLREISNVQEKINEFSDKVDAFEKNTITDLETYMVVKERLIEAEDYADAAINSINNSLDSYFNLAYSKERLYSSYSWAYFFGNGGLKFELDSQTMKNSCLAKLSEAEERFQYFKIFFPTNMENTKKELDYAYNDYNNGDYELCLFKASKAKAAIDVVLGAIGTEEEKLTSLIERKLEVAKQNIIENEKKGIFPILGYSYYEYAYDLIDNDKYSALIYSEYALELSNLDIYFEKKREIEYFDIDSSYFFVFFIGLFLGLLIALRFRKKPKKKRMYTKKKKKKRAKKKK